jgi:hypothetical protein
MPIDYNGLSLLFWYWYIWTVWIEIIGSTYIKMRKKEDKAVRIYFLYGFTLK